MNNKQLIMLEFNEINTDLIAKFIKQGLLPNFKKLYQNSAIYTTSANEEPPYLEPWIQWVTVHSGQEFKEHKVYNLGDGHQLQHPLVGELLSKNGISVGICSSMNTNYKSVNGFYLPDPWDKKGKAQPENLQIFFDTVSEQVQEHSRSDSGALTKMSKFGLFLLSNGLSFSTIKRTVSHLIDEVKNKELKWRRASILDHLQYDVFKKLVKKDNTQFATFFANSVAHFQHYYWRNMNPEVFDSPPSIKESQSYDTAIQYGYQSLDVLIGRVMNDFPNATIALCSALTQQPWTDCEKVTYRPNEFNAFFDFCEIDKNKVTTKPVMAQQFFIECADKENADLVEQRLAQLKLGDEALMTIRRENNSIFSGCRISREIGDDELITNGNGKSILFNDLFYMVCSKRSGKHHPDGLLWISGKAHETEPEKINLTTLAPSILKFFDTDIPSNMVKPEINF